MFLKNKSDFSNFDDKKRKKDPKSTFLKEMDKVSILRNPQKQKNNASKLKLDQ